MNSAAASGWETFPEETLAALGRVLDVDDVVDPEVELPEPLPVDCSSGEMRRCFALSRQFWRSTVHRAELRDLASDLIGHGNLAPPRQARYKALRASYKDLRAATILYAVPHREPWLLGKTVRALGRLQDAYRNGQRGAARTYGVIARALLAEPCWGRVRHDVERTRIDTAAGFAEFRRAEVRRLRASLRQPALPGREFHAMRKIISREVAFHGHLLVLGGDARIRKVERFLSAINGLMGQQHDRLIRQDLDGVHAYASPVPLPPDVRWRLDAFVRAYPR